MKIKNFTCFKDIEFNFKRINIIFGNNGCGKTYLLRCIDLMAHYKAEIKDLSLLAYTLYDIIKQLSVVREFFRNRITRHILSQLSYFSSPQDFLLEAGDVKLDRTILGRSLSNMSIRDGMPFRRIIREEESGDFINKFILYLEGESYWKEFIEIMLDEVNSNLMLKDELKESIKIFHDNVREVTAGRNGLNIFFEGQDAPLSLGYHGYGLKRFVIIMFLSILNKDNILAIDEVDNGLHYDKYGLTTKALLENSKKYNTQLFLTSHSNEYALELLDNIKTLQQEKDVNIFYLYKGISENGEIIKAQTFLSVDEAIKHIRNSSYSFRIV